MNRFLKTLLIAGLILAANGPTLSQDRIGPATPGQQRRIDYIYPGKHFSRLNTVPVITALNIRQVIDVGGSGVTNHKVTWATSGNATIGVTIESSTDGVNWDSVTTSTTESDSHTFEGGFKSIGVTITSLSAGFTDITVRQQEERYPQPI